MQRLLTPLRLLLALLLASLATLGGCIEPPYTNIDNARLQELQSQNVPIYDVRRPEEWRKTGVVAGSRLLTFVDDNGRMLPDFLTSFSAQVGKNDPVILICRTGSRTNTLGHLLADKLGYTQVYNVRRGITGWVAEKLPVVKN